MESVECTDSTGGRPVRGGSPDRGRVRLWHIVTGGVLLVLSAFGSLFVGVAEVTPWGLLHADSAAVLVFLESRVPRLLAILLAGMGMSVAGLVMMHITRNRFVSPSTAGTTESASLGVLVATLFAGSEAVFVKMGVAVVFALAGTFLFLVILRRLTFSDMILAPLVGIMFGAVIGSVTTFFAYRADLLQTLATWTSGDFSGVLRGRYELLWLAGAVTLLATSTLIASRSPGWAAASRSTSVSPTTGSSTPAWCWSP